ncbi:mechanosensitive ion channel family protein [Streptococcus sp. 121]|uniref:mechanosensitive ion channel family protein n=1 Tax=Streptococcus sp. 121 TaxID=2797637 RepID=UPI0018F05C41|nr:mechanosensitive ion channel family protein [Streptococcus sp. 121]MBJ6745994.1 mechanosensitive ion channel family protein [Streptococcus sp. 121]
MQNLVVRTLEKIQWEDLVDQFLSKLLSLLFLFVLFWMGKKLIHGLVHRLLAPSMLLVQSNSARKETLLHLVDNVLNYALYFLLIYWVLSILGLPVSSLLAGAGLAGVVVGLGAQGFLSDMVNGFFILLERQLDVGDYVTLPNGAGKLSGTVENVGIRTTQVRDSNGTLYYIPNRQILIVSNQSRGDVSITLDLPLLPGTDFELVDRIVEQVNQSQLQGFDQLDGQPRVLGPQWNRSEGFVYRISIPIHQGQDAGVAYPIYRLYQDALKEAGVHLSSSSGPTN